MRSLVAALLALVALLHPATGGAAGRDWTSVVARTPAGNYLIGNPRAKVRLVEYLSYTCPHCAAFQRESAAVLRGQMVRSGSTSLEVRPATRDKIDLAAAIVARCAGPAGFVALSDAIYAAQEDWYPRAFRFQQYNDQRLALYPETARLRAYADAAGLIEIAHAHGVGDAALDGCFKDQAALGQLLTTSDQAWRRITGTPTFEVNGTIGGGADWSRLQPVLRAAGAR